MNLEDIDNRVKESKVVLFMKGQPKLPLCGFSGQAAGVLDHLGVEFDSVCVISTPNVRQLLPQYSSWPTFPQLFVNGELVGGVDIMMEMFESGELQELLGI